MNRRYYLMSLIAALPLSVALSPLGSRAASAAGELRVPVLTVDMDRVQVPIDLRIYGHFLEHINHLS